MLSLALAFGVLLPACSSCGGGSKAHPASSAAANLSPVAAPKGLLAELYVPKPTHAWKMLRALAGGPARLLPATYPMLASTLLDIPADAAGLIDAKVPMVGVFLDAGPGHLAAVIGLHVQNGRELVASLCTGKEAKYHELLDGASGVTVLKPVPGKAASEISLGVVGNYLLAADDRPHLLAGGPFVARTLPKRPMPSEPIAVVVPRQALAGPVVADLRKTWAAYRGNLEKAKQQAQARHGGRSADFADPAVALGGANAAVTGLIDVLGSAKQLRLVVEPSQDQLDARLELDPGKSGAAQEFVSSMATASAKPLLALPSDTAFALIERTTKPSRRASSQSTRKTVERLLGKRLSSADRKQLEKTLDDLAEGRSDSLVYALVLGASHPSLALESSVADPKALQRGAKELFGLLRLPAFAEPLQHFVGKLSVLPSTTHVPGISGAVEQRMVKIAPKPGTAAAASSKPFSCLWTIQGSQLFATAGRDSRSVLPELIKAAQGHDNLGSDSRVTAAVQRASDVSFALLLEPLRLGLLSGTGTEGSAPVLLSIGRADGRGVVRLHVAGPVLQGALSLLMRRR